MKIIPIILAIIIGTGSLQSLHLRILDSIDDIVASKKISIHFSFDKNDSVVYADSIRFSVDSADIELKSWQSSQPPATEYIPQFRKNKPVYMDSFNVNLMLDFASATHEEKYATLKESSLYLACLTLGRDGKNRSKNMAISLANIFESKISDKRDNSKKPSVRKESSQQAVNNKEYSYDVWHDDKVFGYVFVYWQSITDAVTSFFESEAFLLCYLALLFIVVFIFIVRAFPKGRVLLFNALWKKELSRLICFAWSGFNIYFFKLFLPIYVVLILVALFFLILGIYYLWEDTERGGIIARLRLGIGMMLMTMVLPLLIKAYLLKSSLLPGE